jgi:glyoxylase-like metal-dependent hydrolase (beta-lactamase superfamily II)
VDALVWVKENVKNPVAILNTHGHFDHVWSNAEVKEALKIPIYCPKDDVFMLTDNPLDQGTPKSIPDFIVTGDEELSIEGITIKFRHFPGHTPGCSIIEINDIWLSGDFLFEQSIGRWDFPASSGEDMVKSLEKAMLIEEDYKVYPGHGASTTLKAEKRVIPFWITQVKSTL